MKIKYLLFLLPLSFLCATEPADLENDYVASNSYSYIITSTSNSNSISTTFTPFYFGFGYRYSIDAKQSIDANISLPTPFIYNNQSTAMLDVSYVRYIENSFYYAFAGVTQEYCNNSCCKYYFVSPFIGFGREFDICGYQMFAQAKVNTLSYFPMLNHVYDDFEVSSNNDFSYWKSTVINFAVGFAF